ncbi:MAG: surface lipoprotein assembly modifier [Thermodesulfobacteriota bacterium]
MLSKKLNRFLILLLLSASGFLFSQFFLMSAPVAFAQPVGEIGAAKDNEAAIERLRKMSTEEIKNLDALLAQALTLYYDRNFAQALPIFKELSDKAETMDIMFWLGTSAAQAGEMNLAVEKFQKMLGIDPSLHRVRLELASVYFTLGRYEDARKELQLVIEANPPPAVKSNIDKMVTAIDESTRKFFWNTRLSTGYMWDDNITSGPDPGIYNLPGGSSFRPAPTSAKLSDQASVTSFAGNLLYDLGEKQGLMWNTAASAYFKSYSDYSEFDYLAMDVNTGPWWSARQSIFKIPAGYTHTEYGSDRLSYILHIDPSYEYFFNKYISLRGSYLYKDERFYQKSRADNFDNISQIVELAPTVYLDNRRHIVSASLGYDLHDAENDAFSYSAPIAGISYFTRFPTRTELYLGYQWTRREYDDSQPFPYNGRKREDARHFFTGVLSQVIFKHFNLSYAFTYTDNDSNLALNDWDRTTHTVSLGCQF